MVVQQVRETWIGAWKNEEGVMVRTLIACLKQYSLYVTFYALKLGSDCLDGWTALEGSPGYGTMDVPAEAHS